MADLVGFENAHCAFESKHLLDAFPLLAKPVVVDLLFFVFYKKNSSFHLLF
jgi:hypothetical protein